MRATRVALVAAAMGASLRACSYPPRSGEAVPAADLKDSAIYQVSAPGVTVSDVSVREGDPKGTGSSHSAPGVLTVEGDFLPSAGAVGGQAVGGGVEWRRVHCSAEDVSITGVEAYGDFRATVELGLQARDW